jgi:hypothetical protein
MSQLLLDVEIPAALSDLRWQEALDRRLQRLLDKQDLTGSPTDEEREEAEYLVELGNTISVLRGYLKLPQNGSNGSA